MPTRPRLPWLTTRWGPALGVASLGSVSPGAQGPLLWPVLVTLHSHPCAPGGSQRFPGWTTSGWDEMAQQAHRLMLAFCSGIKAETRGPWAVRPWPSSASHHTPQGMRYVAPKSRFSPPRKASQVQSEDS